ncbi:Dabb family protein [uncultured Clostridium sp.]|uniref:Dabb family protein n=1 Tax=uncultured Clostridium sp. TaxID=59620 RepID=UPI00262F73C9|nr:Dabb family protein [uncultured Clostridium sp.]
MIKHIVAWKIKDENKKENALKIKAALEDLKDLIPEIKKMEVGININRTDAAMDVVLYSEFDSLKDLDSYQVNPYHVSASAFVKSIVVERKVVDYEVINK